MPDVWRLLSIFGIGFVFLAVFANINRCNVGQAINKPSATDWMQAVGTLGTFFVAIIAFQRWRQPDDAKRRADAAQELIRLNSQLEAKAQWARGGGVTVTFESGPVALEDKLDALKLLSQDPPTDFIERLKVARAELVVREVEIETLFGLSAASTTAGLLKKTEQIIDAYATLRHIAEPMDFVRSQPNFENVVDHHMRVLGVRVVPDEAEGDWFADPFGDELREAGTRSRRALASFLIGTPE